ncbi:MAG: PPC domain-containing protein, partial [Planctomycetaceae bacterium]|nr:PPC domain-containing protein [Planctomycetaceae bacterium]
VLSSLLLMCANASAQVPVVTTLRPVGVQRGQTVDLRTTGSNLAGAKQCWTSCAPAVPPLGDIEGNGNDKATTTYRLAVPAETPLGVHALRVLTDNGVSRLQLLLVDDLPTALDAGGNGSLASAQVINLPAAADGVIDNLSRDFYRFSVEAGQVVNFEIWSRRLGSPLDPVLTLYDAAGNELAYADDTPGLSSDAQLTYTFATSGEFLIEVRDMQFKGGGSHVYRLRMGDFPLVNVPYPAAVQRGQSAEIGFAGLQSADTAKVSVAAPGDSTAHWLPVAIASNGGQQLAFGQVAVSERPQASEQEPNDAGEQANRVELGTDLHGRFETPGDVDRFVFTVTAGTKFDFVGITREVGSPSDLSFRILKPDGGQLVAAEDAGTAEGQVTATFATAGDYVLEVRELSGRSGPEFAWQIQVRPRTPGFELQISTDALSIPQGGVLAIPVTVKRIDYGGEILLTATNLPDGVTCPPAYIGPGQNAGVLTLVAKPEYAATALAPIDIIGTAKVGDTELTSHASAHDALRPHWSSLTVFPSQWEQTLACASSPAKPLSIRFEPAELQFKKGEKPKVKVIAIRGEGLDEAITLATNPDKNAFPANLNLPPQPIAKGQTEIELTLDSNDKTPLGTYSVVFTATHKKGNDTTVVSSTPLVLKVVE